MKFPPEIERQIKQYAQPCANTLRPDWHKGSSIIKLFKHDYWWKHYDYDRSTFITLFGDDEQAMKESMSNTWYAWCRYKMIIAPPRCIPFDELKQFDSDYLYITNDITRHYIPWKRTWFGFSPMALRQKRRKKEQGASSKGDCIDISGKVPNWAIREFMEARFLLV